MATEAKGRYGTLTAGEGFLVGVTDLHDQAAPAAAAEADRRVEEVFFDFDLAAWTSGNPRSVTAAWLKIATGVYLDRIQGANVSDPENARGARLESEGDERLDEIRASGGPILEGGQRQLSVDAKPAGADRAVQIRVT